MSNKQILFAVCLSLSLGFVAFGVKNLVTYRERFGQTEEVDTTKRTINEMGIITGSYPVATGNIIIPKSSDSSLREQLYSRYIKGEPIDLADAWEDAYGDGYKSPIVYSNEELPKVNPKWTNAKGGWIVVRETGDTMTFSDYKKKQKEMYPEMWPPIHLVGTTENKGSTIKNIPMFGGNVLATKKDIDSLKAKIAALDSAVNYNTESIKIYNEILKRLTNPQ